MANYELHQLLHDNLFSVFFRLEFQHGLSLPVPQLEGVCGGLRPALRLCRGGPHLYA